MIIRVICSSALVMRYAKDIHEMLKGYPSNIVVDVQPKEKDIDYIYDNNYYDLVIAVAPAPDKIIFSDKSLMRSFNVSYSGLRFDKNKKILDTNLNGPVLPNTKYIISIHIDDTKPLTFIEEREICNAIVIAMDLRLNEEGE